MGANNDTSFLEQMNGGGWRVVVNIPAKYQDVIGKKKLKQSLGTDSLTEANRRKWPIVNHFKSQISSVSRNALGDIGTARALTLRAKLQAAVLVPMHGQEDSEAEMVAWEIADEAEALQGQPIGTDEHGQPIFDPKREAGAQIFYEVAKGKRTPLMLPAEDFRRQKDESWQGKTWGKFDKITKELEGWLIKRRGVATLEHVDRRAVGEFIASMLKDHGWKHKTLNGYISALSQYWLWLEKRGLVQSNPWQGQGLKEPPKKDVDRERAFNADEMQRLLNGSPNQPYLSDLIRIGALTGARLGSLIELTVGACKNGVFVIPAGKKERQHREVPIHSVLKDIVDRRTLGKQDDEWLFPEVPLLGDNASSQSMRHNPASKAFAYYRKSVGVTDEREGERRSRVNFHSFRRWFITEAEQALSHTEAPGFTWVTIKEVTGHAVADIAMGVYKAPATLAQRRACVEAVKLPTTSA